MKVSVAIQRKRGEQEKKTVYSRGLRNKNGEHLIYPCESNILETKVLEHLKEKNHIKIQINHHRVIENRSIWEGISPMNACWVSQREFYQVLNPV